MANSMSKTIREANARLDRLERRIGAGAEIEDLRTTDIVIYGPAALEDIYRQEGLDSIREIANNPIFTEEERDMIAEFIRRHDHK